MAQVGTKKGFRAWLIVVAISVVAAFVVPYAVLTLLPPSLLIYGFWSVFAFVVAGFIVWGVGSWSDGE